MESYEEFCLRSLVRLKGSEEFKKTCEPQWALKPHSLIRFRGRAVLSPLLNAEQQSEMCELRHQAVQLEAKRQKKQRETPSAQGQVIRGQAQAPSEDSGDSPGPPSDPGFGLQSHDQPAPPSSQMPIGNGLEVVKVESDEEEEEEDDMSVDSLLKRSKKCVKKGQSQQGSSVPTANGSPTPQQENKRTGAVVEFGLSLQHSPVGLPQHPPHHPTLGDCTPQQPDHYTHLLAFENSSSPRPRPRPRRPRPVSTGNIHISFPIGPADLIPRNPGRSGVGLAVAEPPPGATELALSEDVGGVSRSRNGFPSHSGASPTQESLSPVGASDTSPKERRDHLLPGFRRRCHTLDSQLRSSHSRAEHVGRSQERIPRFMVGVTWMPPSRRSAAAPVSQTYKVENPSPSLLRPHITPDATLLQDIQTEETQRRVQALEDMQRRLEEEHALQMSLLLAEQEKAQQRLHLEFQETERRLMEQKCVQQMSGDGCGRTSDRGHTVSPSGSGLSPICTPSERSPGRGFPSPVKSRVSPPSVQSPVFLLGSSWAVGKPRARLSLVLTPEQQRAFCRIGALIRGFLTRRLLKTEKVKHLSQTIVDTQEFIRSFRTEAQNRGACSAQDHSLQERVRAQLRAALYDIHDIFFVLPLGDRLALLQQDRELRAERKLRGMEKAKCPKERVILSTATQRSLDRKKRVVDSPAQARKMQQKPKSPTTNRVKSSQTSPPTGQLNQQGSWYRRTPEERARRENLKKQHSLG
eukprot:XP_011602233.1 PREDICTED: centriolar coiled-coil protein of 110 kDa [Takifugu rubripes]